MMKFSDGFKLSQWTGPSNSSGKVAAPTKKNDTTTRCYSVGSEELANNSNYESLERERKGSLFKIWKFCNSKAPSWDAALFGVNLLQIAAYLVFGLWIVPVFTERDLEGNNLSFILDHIPDSYLDYSFLENASIL